MFLFGVVFILIGVLCFYMSYYQKNAPYPQLPANTKPEQYQRTFAEIWDVAQIEKRENNSSGNGYHYITVYNVYVKFDDNGKSVTAKLNHDFKKTDYFTIGEELEIFYLQYDTSNTSKTWLKILEKGVQMCPEEFQHNVDYTYYVYAVNTDIYTNGYAKNSPFLLNLMGICFVGFGIFAVIASLSELALIISPFI